MQRIFLAGVFLFATLFVSVAMVQADNGDKYGLGDTQKATGGLVPKTLAGAGNVPQLIGKVVAALLSLLAIIFFILIFYAGITWMLARGNSDAVTKAKDIMEAALIGLVIVMASYAISRFVFDRLGATTTDTVTQPTGPETISI